MIGREEQIFEEKETTNTPDSTENTSATDIKKLETNDSRKQDKKVKYSQLSALLSPEDSWMSILNKLTTIDLTI
jgi:hypothetical protein